MSKISIILGLSLTLLHAACGASDAPVAAEPFTPEAETIEPMTRLAVRVNASEANNSRLVVAIFEGNDPWGWTLDVQEQDQTSTTQVLSFSTIEPGLVTARVVLDREPFNWIEPGAEDLVRSQSVGIEAGMNSIEFNLETGDGAVEPVDPVDPEVNADDDGLPVRVGCSCDGLRHAEIAILSGDGEVLQSETLTNPELPTNLTMDGLEAGRYTIAWRTNDEPEWVGERSFRIPLRNAPLMVLIGPNRPDAPPADESEPEPAPNPEPVEEPEPAPEDEPEAEQDELPGGGELGEPAPEDNLQELRENEDFPNQSDRAQPISPNARIEGRLSGVRDFDWFVFRIDQDSTVTIETQGETDTRCEVRRDQDNATAQDDDSGEGNNCRMLFEGLAPGTYRLRISHYSWVGQGDYTLVLQQGVENP